MPAGELAVGRREERRQPDPGRAPGRGDRGRDPADSRREALVGVEPIADRALVAVVELEHVERPRVGEREVVAHGALAHVLEVLVPGAPADDERRVDARAGVRADARRPRLQEQRRVVAVLDRDRVQRRAPSPRPAPRRPATLRRTPRSGRRRSRTRTVPACRSPPVNPMHCTGAPPAASTVTCSDRSSPGCATPGSAWNAARTSGSGSRIVRRVLIDAEAHRAGRRPRLVAVHEQPRVVARRDRRPTRGRPRRARPAPGRGRAPTSAARRRRRDLDRPPARRRTRPAPDSGSLDRVTAGRPYPREQPTRPRHDVRL